jgi:hypothetical protein
VLVSWFPRLRQLELVKNTKSHGSTFARIFSPSTIIFDGGRERPDGRPSEMSRWWSRQKPLATVVVAIRRLSASAALRCAAARR